MSLSDTALVNLIQAKAYLHIDASASLEILAEYVGMGDGEVVEYELDNIPVEGSLRLYVDGALQVEDTDFIISGTTVTFTAAPGNNKSITASYNYAADSDTFEDYDDDLLEMLIDSATVKAEEYTARAFIQREIIEMHIGDGTQVFKLYRQPIVDVDSITIDGDALTTWLERLSIGRLYHSIIWEKDAEIIVTYTAGYGADRAATQALIPAAMTAVLIAIAVWYENRLGVKSQNISGVGSVDYGEIGELPEASKRLLNSLRANIT